MHTGAAVLALSLSGCSLFHNPAASSTMQLGWEVAQQRAALAEAEVRDLRARLDRLETMLRDQGIDGAGGVSMTSLADQVASVRGSVEELLFEQQALRADFDRSRVDVERRLLHGEARVSALERMLAVQPPPPPRVDEGTRQQPTETAVASPVDEPTEPMPAEAGSRLALAEQRMAEGKQAAARAILTTAIAEAGEGPEVAEMQYRLGETWFNEGKFKEAARAFQVVTDKYPISAWSPWAMVRIGECFQALGRPDAAQTFYQGVIRNHPGTEAAAEARAKLKP